jgi:hypothetical protein
MKESDWKKSVVMCFLTVVGSLLLVEGGTRGFANILGMSSYMKYDEALGWTAIAGATRSHRDARLGFDVVYQINAQGFRGPVYQEGKPSGVYRVMVLGDSNGFGWGVLEEQTFAARIDSSFEHVEVLNLSLSGFGTDQEYLRFLKEGMRYRPDLVIVQVTPNDFQEILHPFFNQKPKPYFEFMNSGSLALMNVPVMPIGAKCSEFYESSLPLPFKDWLSWHSYSYVYFNEKYFQLKREFFPGETRADSDERFSPKSISLFNRIMLDLRGKLEEIGARGIIVHASKDISENNYLRDSPLPVVDAYPQFKRHIEDQRSQPYFADRYHWTAEGHRLVAEELVRVIADLAAPLRR